MNLPFFINSFPVFCPFCFFLMQGLFVFPQEDYPHKKVECNSENDFYFRKRFSIGANNGENTLPWAVLRLVLFCAQK